MINDKIEEAEVTRSVNSDLTDIMHILEKYNQPPPLVPQQVEIQEIQILKVVSESDEDLLNVESNKNEELKVKDDELEHPLINDQDPPGSGELIKPESEIVQPLLAVTSLVAI